MTEKPMSEQELRAWSLAIAAITQGGNADLADLIKKAVPILEYISTGDPPPKKNADALYQWGSGDKGK